MKKVVLVVSLLFLFLPIICYGEDLGESAVESSFDDLNELSYQYARKQILNGKTTRTEKKKEGVYLAFPFKNSPYIRFANFVLNGPTNEYGGFIETIFYRDKIKIKDMYYEKNPVKTDKIGIYSTDLCFTSEEGVIYHYKNVPYLVSSDKPTTFFSEVNFNKENKTITGEIKMPASKNTFQIELFYTDNDEYHYQESSVDKNGSFSIDLNRDGTEGEMYLRASDGLGNYADATDIVKQGSTIYPIKPDDLKAIEESYKVVKIEKNRLGVLLIIFIRILGVIVILLTLLRLRVLLKRRKKRRMLKRNR
ncbi:hypothetical protein [Enterococcus ureasiticus]|uniref:Uncharacterized protein n=1 Tax=Enterococcus ureasiticus TaxID=903984 RepID=A0A1E5GPE8_9ENTE|nr:hypothetical protein [Enterococcus ureasiticus]OEG14455.1 hypothetical protein BCR21_05550 [Enterococcus ureasiticus]